jgi:hypothetical protein
VLHLLTNPKTENDLAKVQNKNGFFTLLEFLYFGHKRIKKHFTNEGAP